jgi:hypothetical protein
VKKVLSIGTTTGEGGKAVPFELPRDFVTRTLAIAAIRGAGKTVAATVIAEEMCEAGLPWIAFDPAPGGVWWGLRCSPDGSPGGYPVLVIGGKHGDLPFRRESAIPLAEAFIRENVCIVVDVHREHKSTMRAFVAEFCDRLMELEDSEAPSPRHVFLEEAPEFVPQKPMAEQKRSRAAVDRVVRLGRNAGYGATLLTQRFATVDKDVLTQCENILAMRSVGKPDRRAFKEWIAETVSPAPDDPQVEEFLGSLVNLPDGEGWFWSPQWLKRFERVRIRERKTYHPGRTRSIDDAVVSVQLSSVADFVERFRPVLDAKPKGKRAMVDVSVRGGPPDFVEGEEIVEVDREGGIHGTGRTAATLKRTAIRDRTGEPSAERAAAQGRVELERRSERLAAVEDEAARLRGQVADQHRQLGAARATLQALRQALEPQYKALARLFSELDSAQTTAGIDRAPFEAWFPKLRGGGRKLLTTLLDNGGELTIRQLAVLSRRKIGNGAWRADIGQLRSCGLVEPGDPVKLRIP